MQKITLLVLLAAPLLCAARADAHLDTLMQVLDPTPLVKEFEAEACPNIPPEFLVKDARAKGGLAVRCAPRTPVFRVSFGTLPVGMYEVYVIAKVTDANAWVGNECRPLNMAFRLHAPGGRTEFWSMRVAYNDAFNEVAHFYFHTPVRGEYSAEIYVDDRSQVKPVVDRIMLLNPLRDSFFRPVKTKRVIHTDPEISRMRQAAEREKKLPRPVTGKPLSAEEASARDAVIWNALMPLNANPAGRQLYYGIGRGHADDRKVIMARAGAKAGRDIGKWEWPHGRTDSYDKPWRIVNQTLNLTYTLEDYNANKPLPKPWPISEDKGAFFYDKETWGTKESFNFGTIPVFMGRRYATVLRQLDRGYAGPLVQRYLFLDDRQAAADAAFLLAAYAYRYPSYDFHAHCMVNIYCKGRRFDPGHGYGRGCGYEGWTTKNVVGILQTYDALFPYIKGNGELARRVGRFVPWVKTPDDVVRLIDTFLVQRAAVDGLTMVLYSSAIPWAAAVLGPNDISTKIMDRYFTRAYLRNTLSGFPDSIVNGYSRDGLNYIGSTYYTQGESAGELGSIAELLARYVRAGGDAKFDVGDTKRFPRFGAVPLSLFDLYVAGGYGSNIGDVASPDGQRRLNPDPAKFAALFRRAWRQTAHPKIAWLLATRIGQGELTDEEWTEITKIAGQTPDPYLHQESRHLGGFGLTVMEEGGDNPDYRQKRTVTIRTGVGSGHAQGDSLDIQFYAHGLRMLSDLGGRVSRRYGKPTCMSTYVHNVVEVDEKSHNGGVMNATGTAWLEAFKPMPGAQFTLAGSRAESHPEVSLYQRATALIAVDESGEGQTANAYVFDVFRVRGGKVHTWCFKGVPPDDFAVNSDLTAAKTGTATKYLSRHRPGSAREGLAKNVVEATWRLRRTEDVVKIGDKDVKLHNSEQYMLQREYDPGSPRKYTRVSIFGHGGDRLLVGNWYCTAFKRREFDWPFLYVRRQSKAGSTWPTIIEAYAGRRYIASARQLETTVQPAGVDFDAGLAPVALEVKTTNGFTDVLYSGFAGATSRLSGGITASGDFAFIRTDADGVALMHMVGGQILSGAGIELKAMRPALEGKILEVDYRNMQFTVSGKWPVSVVVGQQLTVHNDRHFTNCRVVQAEPQGRNTRITFARTAALYQGGVEHVDAAEGVAALDLPPYLYDYHKLYYEGMTAANEVGKPLGRISVAKGERFMYLGWPDWHRHVQGISWKDIPDADGDGRRTLRMYLSASGATKGYYLQDDGTVATLEPGTHMLDLEVTRVREDGFMFWYKQHPLRYLDSLKMPHPGWPYHRQLLKNEDGSRSWTSSLPGDTYQFTLEGRKLTEADFPDTNGDGRRLVRFYDFGPGDTVTMPTHVYLRRLPDGAYALRADVDASGTIKGRAFSVKIADLKDGEITIPVK